MCAFGRFCLVCWLLFLTAHRLPAPISEESPTPAVESRPKARMPRKTPAAERSAQLTKSKTPTPTPNSQPYAGTWIGSVDWGVFGITQHTIVIDPAQRTVNITGCGSGTTFSASITTSGISWATGYFREHKWTLRPSADGTSAVVTANGQSVIFKRLR